MPLTSWRLFRCLMLGTALVVAALAAACDGPRTDPSPSPAPTATAAPSPAPTPTTALMPTPSPTDIEPAPAPTPRPSPEPTLQDRIDTLFSQYRDNAPFNDHLNKLSDYQSPTQENLASFQTLSAYATQDFELTKRAVIASGFLGLDSSEANLTIDAYLKYQQKYGLQDPTRFASVTDLMLFQNQLNTPGKIRLPDGQEEGRRGYILSSEERIEALIAGSDIWSWLALPERDLATVPDWFAETYPNDTKNEAIRQKVFLGPFSSNVPFPVLVSHPKEVWAERQRNLDNFDIQANSTASVLEALANGTSNIDYHFASEYVDLAVRRLDFLIANKSHFMKELDVRSRAFVDDIGDFNFFAAYREYSKDLFKQALDIKEAGAFRLLGYEDPNRVIFPYPSNEDIILFVTGSTFRLNIIQAGGPPGTEGLRNYNPELFGFMYTTENGRDPLGDFVEWYSHTISKGGRQIAVGEPKLVVSQICF